MIKKLFEGFRWRTNVYRAVGAYVLLAMGFYTLCRVGFYFFNLGFFPDMTAGRFLRILLGGMRFDLVAVIYTNSLFLLLLILPFQFRFHPLYQKVLKYIFLITNGLALATNVADFIYYRFNLRRSSLLVIDQFQNERNWGPLIFHFAIGYWYGIVFWVALMILLVVLYNRIKFDGPQLKNKTTFYSTGVLVMVVLIGLSIGGARGSFARFRSPITLIDAGEYTTVPRDINLVLNTPFAVMKTDRTRIFKKSSYFASEDALKEAFDPVKIPKGKGAFRTDNVVVIILESFSQEFMGAYSRNPEKPEEKGYTPFLDSLIGSSRAYRYSMANGLRSVDAMPSVICSIPATEVSYLGSHHSGNKVNSIASLLKEKGYHTAYFHGAHNGTMGFEAFAKFCGFDEYYGKDEYNQDEDYDGTWGIWDEQFFQFFALKMNTFQQPFCTTLHTVTSHDPYRLPAAYESKFKGGPMPIHRTIEYTDYSVRKFFESASQMPWFNNTFFVFTADHGGTWGNISIPIFFYKPGANWSAFSPEVVEQLDIMPTILGYLNYDKPYVSFGRDVFNEDTEPFGFFYLDNNYQAYMGDYLLFFDGTKSTYLYNFKTDPKLENNILSQLDEAARIEKKLKGFIQQHSNRVVDDNLTVEGPQKSVVGK